MSLALFVTGAPGSGKSTVGAELARRLRGALIDLDTATETMTAVVGDLLGVHDLDDPRLARATRDARYAAIEALALDSLRVGTDVVLVAPFTRERRDPAAWETARLRMAEAGGRAILIWLRIDAEEVARRIRGRGAGRDLAKVDPEWVAALDLEPPAVAHVAVDARRTPAKIAQDVLGEVLLA
ncbi:AAA family ATPase [Nostocoides veronense]|uniref:ATP-binding protein n=1 Tax=Nostocoides veronense TaxID=330836 RepID=A0ABN2L9D7_9MICO